VPFADTSTYKLPPSILDEQAVMLSDILPTSYEVGVLNGAVRPADAVAIVGAGPIGLAATLTSRLFSPRLVIVIDTADSRLQMAKHFGADETLNPTRDDINARVRALTDELGADVVIEAVGVPETFELCTELVRPGGHVANVGVHGKPASLALDKLWAADLTITTGLVDTYSTPTLLQMVASRQIDAAPFVTHHYQLDHIVSAYDTFARAADTNALKVVITK